MFFKLFVCGLIFHVCALVFPASSASCFLLSVCPSVRLSVRSSGLSFTKVVNTLCWKRMNRFWYTLVQVGKGIKRSTLGVRRSKVKVKQGRRFGGLTETSFSTMVSSLFTILCGIHNSFTHVLCFFVLFICICDASIKLLISWLYCLFLLISLCHPVPFFSLLFSPTYHSSTVWFFTDISSFSVLIDNFNKY